jgi:thiol-disulfide isomerase/thioredoxin
MKLFLIIFFIFHLIDVNAVKNGAVELTDDSFKEKISSGDVWLVEFYAPWYLILFYDIIYLILTFSIDLRCGHCRKLAPIFDAVANNVSTNPLFKIGKVNAPSNREIADIYTVTAYPTILYFKNNIYGKYDGPRTKDGMISFLNKLISDEYSIVKSSDELNLAIQNIDYGFVLIVSSSNTDQTTQTWKDIFIKLSKKHYMRSHFIMYIQDSVQDHIQPSFIKMEQNRPSITASVESDLTNILYDLNQFIEINSRKMISIIDSHNFKKLASLNRTMCLLVYDPNSLNKDLINAFEDIFSNSVKAQSELVLAEVDGLKWRKFFKQYGVRALPSILYLDLSKELYSVIPVYPPSPMEIIQDYKKVMDSAHELFAQNILQMNQHKKLNIFDKIWNKFQQYFPWSLLSFIPVILLITSYYMPRPDSKHKLD